MAKNEKTITVEENVKKSCFIITPIGDETDPIRRHIDGIIEAVFEPVLEMHNYRAYVPHQMAMPGPIDNQIIKKIYSCDLVIVNLTNVNPNVMYELALRHCFNKPSIIIAEKGTKIPFDIGMQRIIFYINDAKGVLALRADLEEAIKELNNGERYVSSVLSALKEFGIEEVIKAEDITFDKSEASALSIMLDRIDKIEKAIYTISPPVSPIVDSESITKIEHQLIISGEKPIAYGVRDFLRYIMRTSHIDYKMERGIEDLEMTITMQFPSTANWRDFMKTVSNVCRSYGLRIEMIK